MVQWKAEERVRIVEQDHRSRRTGAAERWDWIDQMAGIRVFYCDQQWIDTGSGPGMPLCRHPGRAALPLTRASIHRLADLTRGFLLLGFVVVVFFAGISATGSTGARAAIAAWNRLA